MSRRMVLYSVHSLDVDEIVVELVSRGIPVTARPFDDTRTALTVETSLSPDALATVLRGFADAVSLFDAEDGRFVVAASDSLDYQWDDSPVPCTHCIGWRWEQVRTARNLLVLREWHEPSCPTIIEWS